MVKNSIAICQEIFPDSPFQELCDKIHQIGYDGIEIAPYKFASDIRLLSHEHRNEIRRNAESADLQLPAAHWLLVSPPGLHITNPDPAINKNTKEYFRELMNFCQELGVKVLVFGSPKQRSILPEWNYSRARKTGIEFFQEMGDLANKLDLTIALEPLGISVSNFIHSTHDALEILREIHHPHIKFHLDIAALFRDELNPLEQIKIIPSDLLAHIHLNEPGGWGPGMGQTDITPIINKILEKFGHTYHGWYSVETFQKDCESELIAQKSLEFFQKYLRFI